jgi:hypothetical protein
MVRKDLIKFSNGLEVFGDDHRLTSSDEIPIGYFFENELGERGVFLGIKNGKAFGLKLKGEYNLELWGSFLQDVQVREGWNGKSLDFLGAIDEENVSKLQEIVGTNQHFGYKAEEYYKRMKMLENSGIYFLPIDKKKIPKWANFSDLEKMVEKARELEIPVIFDERFGVVDYIKKDKSDKIISKGSNGPIDNSILKKEWETIYLGGGNFLDSFKEAAKWLNKNNLFFEVSSDMIFYNGWTKKHSSTEGYFTRLENSNKMKKLRYCTSFIPEPLTDYFKK